MSSRQGVRERFAQASASSPPRGSSRGPATTMTAIAAIPAGPKPRSLAARSSSGGGVSDGMGGSHFRASKTTSGKALTTSSGSWARTEAAESIRPAPASRMSDWKRRRDGPIAPLPDQPAEDGPEREAATAEGYIGLGVTGGEPGVAVLDQVRDDGTGDHPRRRADRAADERTPEPRTLRLRLEAEPLAERGGGRCGGARKAGAARRGH